MQNREYIIKKRIRAVLVIMGLVAFFFTPFFAVLKSYSVMFVYSNMHEKNAFVEEEDIQIKIPGGISTLQKDYYPFVIAFDTGDMFGKKYSSVKDLLIYYNFGAMDWFKGASELYQPDSKYYNAFYGAYLVRVEQGEEVFGKSGGEFDGDEVMSITDYDLKQLVMKSIGNSSPEVEYAFKQNIPVDEVEIDGYDFKVYDAVITMDSMYHQYEKDYMAYIQYGTPERLNGIYDENSFEPVEMKGRIYTYFNEEKGISCFMYIIGRNTEVIVETEENFIYKTKISGI